MESSNKLVLADVSALDVLAGIRSFQEYHGIWLNAWHQAWFVETAASETEHGTW